MDAIDLQLLGLVFGIFGVTLIAAPTLYWQYWDRIKMRTHPISVDKVTRQDKVNWGSAIVGYILLFISFILQFLAINWIFS